MSTSASSARGVSRRSVRIASSALAVGALAAGTMAMTTTSADAASNNTWNRLAQCESGGRWHINSTYDGGLQFSESTWSAYGGGKFAPHAYQAKRWQQIAIAEKVLDGQGWGAWPSCSSQLGLTRADAAEKWEGRPRKMLEKAGGKDRGSARVRLHSMTTPRADLAWSPMRMLRSSTIR